MATARRWGAVVWAGTPQTAWLGQTAGAGSVPGPHRTLLGGCIFSTRRRRPTRSDAHHHPEVATCLSTPFPLVSGTREEAEAIPPPPGSPRIFSCAARAGCWRGGAATCIAPRLSRAGGGPERGRRRRQRVSTEEAAVTHVLSSPRRRPPPPAPVTVGDASTGPAAEPRRAINLQTTGWQDYSMRPAANQHRVHQIKASIFNCQVSLLGYSLLGQSVPGSRVGDTFYDLG